MLWSKDEATLWLLKNSFLYAERHSLSPGIFKEVSAIINKLKKLRVKYKTEKGKLSTQKGMEIFWKDGRSVQEPVDPASICYWQQQEKGWIWSVRRRKYKLRRKWWEIFITLAEKHYEIKEVQRNSSSSGKSGFLNPLSHLLSNPPVFKLSLA